MKKITILTTLVFTLLFSLGFKTSAYSLVDLASTDGGVVTYRGSDEVVQIPDVYELNGTEFRGAWVSRFAGDIGSYVDKETWISDVAGLIEVFKAYNLNTMIFHIRTHNNALYDSDLNPIASWWTEVDFDEFDPLEYLIDECHKAGIEFHAWMNPYRITTKTNDIEEAMAEGQYLGEKVPSSNPARFAGNLIAGKAGVILNPGLPKVRDFIVETCMEVVRKYDVDAIHFDDYFYISGSVDDDTFAKYNPKKLSLADWRREQVNLFIEQLHDEMIAYNEEFDKAVQIGISPSGIYRNGNGSVESGSNTAGFAHYGDYLYSDTYKWAKEGWIDYLLPQSYWAFEHPSAGYADVMDWWN
ncbi:MAG: family 10 glycosylhydrolase, partial [Bacilli bacterium]|nr:family 10 glycosylhydrolase [Bacilli bacterium]